MAKKYTSLLQELTSAQSPIQSADSIEMRASHSISSAIYVFEQIDRAFSPAEAEDLKRKFINSIRSGDPGKFSRSIKRAKDE